MRPWTSGMNMTSFEGSSTFATSTSLYSAILSSRSMRAPSTLSLDLLVTSIHNVLLCITLSHKDSPSKKLNKVNSGNKLKELVQPVASEFSNLLEGISQGAEKVSNQKFFTSKLSSEAHTVALDVLNGLGNVHWVAVGLLAIAKVLERLDMISSNDTECVDLLKGMLHLTKSLKRIEDANANLQEEMLEKMCETVHLIVSGAILCRSFITFNKVSKFLLATKIENELIYLRGKVHSMKIDLILQVQIMNMSTSRQQLETPNAGELGGIDNIIGEEAPDAGELGGIDNIIGEEAPDAGVDNIQEEFQPNGDGKDDHLAIERASSNFSRIGRFLKTTTYGLKKITKSFTKSNRMKNGA